MQFQIAQPGRQGQNVHLASGVVDVILAGYVPASEFEQRRKTRAVGRAASVADVQRPGRIGRNELDLYLPPPAFFRPAKIPALPEDGANDFQLGRAAQMKVDEARASHLGPLDEGRRRHSSEQRLRDFPWIALHRPRELHREIAGKIAVLRLPGPLQNDGRVRPIRRKGGQGRAHQIGKMGLDIDAHCLAFLYGKA